MQIHDNKHSQISSLLNDRIKILEVHIGKMLATIHNIPETPISNRYANSIQPRIMNGLNVLGLDPCSIMIVEIDVGLCLTEGVHAVKFRALIGAA